MSRNLFDVQKNTCLSAVDLSRKGSIDAPILDLVTFINNQINFFTTSSCSGRLIVVDNDVDGIIRKQGCKWILTSHDCISWLDLKESLADVVGNAVFKFEPFVMHVQCRTLEDAQCLLSNAVGSGYRNSGICVGNKGKFITAIRSTHSLEVPLTNCGKILVSDEYLEFIVNAANGKMKENFERINRLFSNLKTSLTEKKCNDNVSAKKKEKDDTKSESERLKYNAASKICDGNKTDNMSDSIEDLLQTSLFVEENDT